ncbi:type II secretion system inner membrane protein GspF [Archangium sp.]|jgi:general secretion pathway protein F|uniref:type II secretion system inner membrane protein GspF n=1 Tax=Archangium sp. TaxID=1872627 RepID=UPI002EDB979F
MPVFEYKGLNQAGKPIKGILEADSPKTLRSQLRKDGIFLTDVIGQAEGSRAGVRKGANAAHADRELKMGGGGRISTDDIAITTRQLATLLGAGVTLVEALTALVDQVEKEKLKRIISDVKQNVNEGKSLGDALAAHEKVFGALYVNMVRSGEHSGALDAVLLRLADFTESQSKLQQKIIGTMTYPAIMMLVGVGILTLLMVVVIPKVTKIFTTMKATLPITTRALIFGSNFLRDWWFILFPAIFGIIFGLTTYFRSPKGKPVWDRFALKAPIFGSLLRLLAISRFSRTLATLLKSGVPLLVAMDITKAVMTNSVLAEVVEKARDAIREGESIAGPLKRSGEFPPLVYHMVAIGERSGQLEDMLLSVADSYENQVNVRIGALTSMLEPLLTVFMGVIIAFVAFSVLMPILQVNSAIR